MELDIYEMAEDNAIKKMKLLIEQGVSVNKKNEFGFSPLHLAISNEHEEMSLLLLNAGSNGKIQDDNGFTALHYAAEYGLYTVANNILEKTPEALHVENDHGNQPLWTAIFNTDRKYKLVSLFISFNPNINHKNKVGKSPLDMAKNRNSNELVNILLQAN